MTGGLGLCRAVQPELLSDDTVAECHSTAGYIQMPAPHLARHDAPFDPALAAILRRCAERDPNCLHDLEAAVGEQVRAVLARALGSSDIANFALPAVLSDLRDRAGLFEPDRQPAEDWVFGQVRARLRELTQAATQFPASRLTIIRPAPPMPQARQ